MRTRVTPFWLTIFLAGSLIAITEMPGDATAGAVPSPTRKCKRLQQFGGCRSNSNELAFLVCYISELRKAKRNGKGDRRSVQKQIGEMNARKNFYKGWRREINFSGEWATNIEDITIVHFKRNDKVQGTWTGGDGGTISGCVFKNWARGTWSSGGDSGAFAIRMKPNGNQWGGNCSGPWVGTRK